MPKRRKLNDDDYDEDAKMGRYVANRRSDIEQRKYQPTKSSERIRAKGLLPASQKWSGSMKYEEDSESIPSTSFSAEDQDQDPLESDPEDADTNPQWHIYELIRSSPLSEPFKRLPSRRFYPDYYQEIKNPMSMSKIRTKVKTGVYKDTVEVVEDMNVMFENAKQYNRPDSKLFKDAGKLQKILHSHAKDILNYNVKDSMSETTDTENEDSLSSIPSKKSSKTKKSLSSQMTHELKKARRTQHDVDIQLKKRMKLLYKTLIEFTDEYGRYLVTMFMERPSKKDYPDYYEIIKNPIDLKTIEANIKWDRYTSEDTLIFDFKVMFENCKQYNEEGSQIYRDSETLELVLSEKIKELGPFQPVKQKKVRAKSNTVTQQRLRTLYDTLINYTDNKGRQLSSMFMKLPSKVDYPDYYDVIKRPLDLEKIGTKLRNGIYETLDDLLSDFILIFDNGCKYNESDSQIYKDALSLQQVALQTKLELADSDPGAQPDIRLLVQDLLTKLFISVYNHQDEEGRCYSDSITELFEVDTRQQENEETRPISFDVIKRNLDKGKYRRLDRFQQDMFEVFDRTRKISRSDSQAFEDSVELQTYLIRLRNELCKAGEAFQSPALYYTESDHTASVEMLKAEKIPKEQQEAEQYPETDLENKQTEKEPTVNLIQTESFEEGVSFNEQHYRLGDFVFIEPREKTMDPHIIHIEKFWRDINNEILIYGCWFFRPGETYHLASKKFLENEVFKSDSYNNTPLNQVVGRCSVMFVKDYFKYKPRAFEDKDVFVCESRYFTKLKTFKKIKVWQYRCEDLIVREELLPMVRVQSVFKDRTESRREDYEEDVEVDVGPKVLDIERQNCICDPPEGIQYEEGSLFYEQFTIPCGSFKLGDCCYVRTDQGRNLICSIERMWVEKDGNAFFHGSWFVQPSELPHSTSHFYPNEAFLSSIQDTNPLLSIVRRCCVMEYKDYVTKRVTEIEESDVYICESTYVEHEKKFMKLTKFLPKFNSTGSAVIEDEYYIFKNPLQLNKNECDKGSIVVARKSQQSTLEVPSPVIGMRPSSETENEESNDMPPIFIEQPITNTPVAVTKKKVSRRTVTGYIMFASEVRRSVVQAHPDHSFGDISRIIGTEWKNLTTEQKQEYEQKAQRQNEESAKEAAKEAENMPQSPAAAPNTQIENGVYECHWESSCDFQCEECMDLLDHLTLEPNGHVWRSYDHIKDKETPEFQCLFQGCGRVKKGAAPFPSIARLIRHCKEVHVNKQVQKSVLPENRSRNFIPSRKNVSSPAVAATSSNVAQIQTQTPPIPQITQTASTGVQAKPVEPIFVSTPPRESRLLHSHTYLKYIERMRQNCKHVNNWETQLNATPETVQSIESKLPTHWLSNGAGNHGNLLNALWALRNFMLQDSLNIYKS